MVRFLESLLPMMFWSRPVPCTFGWYFLKNDSLSDPQAIEAIHAHLRDNYDYLDVFERPGMMLPEHPRILQRHCLEIALFKTKHSVESQAIRYLPGRIVHWLENQTLYNQVPVRYQQKPASGKIKLTLLSRDVPYLRQKPIPRTPTYRGDRFYSTQRYVE
jgi:phage gp36-like protein